jgi:hypothetical protein
MSGSLLTFASVSMRYRDFGVSVVAVTTIVTKAASRVMLAADAYAATFSSRKQIELLVEATFVGMRITIASFNRFHTKHMQKN